MFLRTQIKVKNIYLKSYSLFLRFVPCFGFQVLLLTASSASSFTYRLLGGCVFLRLLCFMNALLWHTIDVKKFGKTRKQLKQSVDIGWENGCLDAQYYLSSLVIITLFVHGS